MPSTPAAVQKDGKMIGIYAEFLTESPVTYAFKAVRLKADGSGLDSSFGTAGKAFASFLNYAVPSAVLIQPDGKILLGGDQYKDTDDHFALARFNIDGTIDNSFGQNGTVITKQVFGAITKMGCQSTGKIIAAGGYSANELIRYNLDGSIDSSFGINGIALSPGTEFDALIIQNDDKIVCTAIDSNKRCTIQRVLADGNSMDSSYGGKRNSGDQ